MREKHYSLRYEGKVFQIGNPKPPKLVKLGSGEILEWFNTRYNNGQIFADYRKAEIREYSYLHSTLKD